MVSNVNNQFKELVNEAIHNHFHDKTETEMILKDWLYGICEQLDEYEAKAESYTKLASQISAMDAIVATNYDKDMTDTNLHLLMLGAEVKRFFESGEPYA